MFGKTKGMDLRSFSKDGDMEFYQDSHFIAMTGDGVGYYDLESFDTPEMKSLLERKLERRTEWKNVGKGMSGLTQLDDRELLEKALGLRSWMTGNFSKKRFRQRTEIRSSGCITAKI